MDDTFLTKSIFSSPIHIRLIMIIDHCSIMFKSNLQHDKKTERYS